MRVSLAVNLLVPVLLASCSRPPGQALGGEDATPRLDAQPVPDTGPEAVCGDGDCTASETSQTCPADCAIVSLAATDGQTCAARVDGTVLCWGDILAPPSCSAAAAVPAILDGPRSTISLSGALGTACAVQASGRLICWGSNEYGQLGTGAVTASELPGEVVDLREVVEGAVGGLSSCAVNATGDVHCWGHARDGLIGVAEDDPRVTWVPYSDASGQETIPLLLTPTRVEGIGSVVRIASARNTTCVLVDGGAMACWGQNAIPYLDVPFPGDCHSSTVPCSVRFAASVQPVLMPGIAQAATLGVGAWHLCVLHRNAAASCWGFGTEGQLGDGLGADSVDPVPVTGLDDGAALASSGSHSCAVTASGEVRCWGRRSELGLNPIAGPDLLQPELVPGLAGAILAIALGRDHACVALRDGTVRCWGENCHGQLGDGTSTSSLTPVAVIGL